MFWPCAANSWKMGSSDEVSAGFHPHEQLSSLEILSVAMRLNMSLSPTPMDVVPGAM